MGFSFASIEANRSCCCLAREIAELSSATEQKPKRKPRKQTTDEEKLVNLYKNVENSAFTGQGNISQKIEGRAHHPNISVIGDR